MKSTGRALKPLVLTETGLRILDQRRLPGKVEYVECRTPAQVARAISRMAVRGAPAIGLCGAYGMVLAARDVARSPSRNAPGRLAGYASTIASARPTAADLGAAVDRVLSRIEASTAGDCEEAALAEATAIRDELDEACRSVAMLGSELLRGVSKVLTYCNTGVLATGVSTGTALGVIECRARLAGNLHVWVPETRPYLQGSRLTAFELALQGISHTVVTDATCGFLMSAGEVDAVVVGADRIAVNGDTANKIGTYQLAVLAKRHGIPFYVAAPSSTFDLSIVDGSQIPVEVRKGAELLGNAWKGARLTPPSTFYPAFDVTPAELITALVCEKGVLRPPYEESISQALA